MFIVVAGISESLPVSVLLGRDVLQLVCLRERGDHDGNPETGSEEALVVMTRAQAQTEAEILASKEQREEAVEVRSKCPSTEPESDIDVEQEVLGAEFDPDLFREGRDRRNQSRRQKRTCRQEVTAEQKAESQHPLDELSAEELQALQGSDPTLAMVRKAADGETISAGRGFFRRDGVIYRSWTPGPGSRCGNNRATCPPSTLQADCSRALPPDPLGWPPGEEQNGRPYPSAILLADSVPGCRTLLLIVSGVPEVFHEAGSQSPHGPPSHRPGAVQTHRDGCPRALTPQPIGTSINCRDLRLCNAIDTQKGSPSSQSTPST